MKGNKSYKLNISVPADLHERWQKYKGSISLSRLAQDALKDAIDKYDKFEEWYKLQKKNK